MTSYDNGFFLCVQTIAAYFKAKKMSLAVRARVTPRFILSEVGWSWSRSGLDQPLGTMSSSGKPWRPRDRRGDWPWCLQLWPFISHTWNCIYTTHGIFLVLVYIYIYAYLYYIPKKHENVDKYILPARWFKGKLWKPSIFPLGSWHCPVSSFLQNPSEVSVS